MISYIIPTRNRPRRLAQTLQAIIALGGHEAVGGAEVIVIDNGSERPVDVSLASGGRVPVRLIRNEINEGAAARNRGAAAADPRSDWLLMLDDDSFPADAGHLAVLRDEAADVAAVSADIVVPPAGDAVERLGLSLASWPREQGGLPEVFIGCGVAIRRGVYLELGGYDASFHYYAEEYDLAARMIRAGYRVRYSRDFRVVHTKDAAQRDMNTILGRLVRNSGWVAQRYSPEDDRPGQVREVRRRYRAIAAKEDAIRGFGAGLVELRRTIRRQPRTPLSRSQFDRFTGLAHAREALESAYRASPFRTAAVVDAGKNAWAVWRSLRELGVRIVDEDDAADVRVIGTMSPGPMLDALDRAPSGRTIAPWLGALAGVPASARRLAA